jgi:hypothetical protein
MLKGDAQENVQGDAQENVQGAQKVLDKFPGADGLSR